jgi:hypothetical protein
MLRQITIEFGLPGESEPLRQERQSLSYFRALMKENRPGFRVSVKWRSSFSFEQDDAG